MMLSFVWILMFLLCHIFLNSALTPVALAILPLISLLQSPSIVNKLPRYTNSMTFSTLLLSATRCYPISFLPLTMVFVLLMLIFNHAALSDSSTILKLSCSLSLLSSSKSISSANIRLLNKMPCTKTFVYHAS